MVQTIEEIEEVIDNEVSIRRPDLTSTSKLAVWQNWKYIVSFIVNLFQKENKAFEEEMDEKAKLYQVTNLQWYRQITLDFLYGKALVWNDDIMRFEQLLDEGENSEDFKIVDYCAAVKTPGKVRIKVAKNISNTPGQLTTPEKDAIESYLLKMQGASDVIELVNNVADDIRIEIDVYVDPLLIDKSNGELHADGTSPVDEAIDNYLKNLEFNGAFVLTKFDDAIQSAQGVIDIKRVSIESRFGVAAYEDIDVQLIADAGYFKIDSLIINYK